MKRSYFNFLLILIILLLFSTVVDANEEKEVKVEGMAYINNDNLVKAQEEAINNGLRKAVEQVVGVFITSTTKTKNMILIEDKILKKSQGYIKAYKILNESIVQSNYKVRLKVIVGTGKLSHDLEALRLNIKRHNNPRMMVVIGEEVEGYNVDLPAGVVETEMINKFIEAGYQVVDRYQVEDVINRDQRRAIINGNCEMAVKLGLELKSEFIVVGAARASYIKTDGLYDGAVRDLDSYNAQIDARVINTTTGQIVAAVSDEETGVGSNKESAAKQAFDKVAGNLTEKLIDKVSTDLIQDEQTLQLKVNGISFMQLRDLKSKLAGLTEVRNVYSREYEDGLAILDIDLEPTVEVDSLVFKLADRVNFDFVVNSFSASKVILEVRE